MYILALETTGAFASVALMKDGEIIQSIRGYDRFSHLKNLMPQTKEVLDRAKLDINEIDYIAVSCGPGSFTGIRIGISSARALAQMLRIPCIPVLSLEALAYDRDVREGTLICPMLDARRESVYAAGYIRDNGKDIEVIKAAPYTVMELIENIKKYKNILFMGDGIDKYGDIFMELEDISIEVLEEEFRYQDATRVAMIGYEKAKVGITCEYYNLNPEYMRIPEAERKLKEKLEGGEK